MSVPQSTTTTSLTSQTPQKDTDCLIESSTKSLKCGISWDFVDKAIDLDITVVALNIHSIEMDAAYYNQTHILNDSIIHSGDNKLGNGDGDNESILIKLDKLATNCNSIWFILNAFEGGTFKDVKNAQFTLYNNNNDNNSLPIHSYQISMAGFDETALLLGVLYKNQYSTVWKYKKLQKGGYGSNFVESKDLIENNLNIIYTKKVLNERPKDRTKIYKLNKSDKYVLDPNITKVTVGLGWDPVAIDPDADKTTNDDITDKTTDKTTDGSTHTSGQTTDDDKDIDVDGSVIVYTRVDNDLQQKDIVYYGNLTGDCDEFSGDCIKHSGDNLTGDGGGDNEKIDIFFDELNKRNDIHTLCVVVNIYSGAKSFNEIENCFVRLVDDKNHELCKYMLTGSYNTRGMIMCSISKSNNGCWCMIAHGIGCNGKKASESAEQCKQVCRKNILNYDIDNKDNNDNDNNNNNNINSKKRPLPDDLIQDQTPTKRIKCNQPKSTWSTKDVAEWISSLALNYKQYYGAIIHNGVDGELLTELLNDNNNNGFDALQEYIPSKVHRTKVMLKWKQLN